ALLPVYRARQENRQLQSLRRTTTPTPDTSAPRPTSSIPRAQRRRQSPRTTQTASCRYRLQPRPEAQEPPPIRRAERDYSRIVARVPSPHWKWVHGRPRIRIRSGQRGRRTAARVADIRVSRIQAPLDQNPANRSERRPVRYKPPAREESSTVVARRSCGWLDPH